MDNANKQKEISREAVKRLPRYFRYFRRLLLSGIMRTSSGQIARALGITQSQVRSDLNCLDGIGQQGYGYNVKALYTEISRKLGAGDGMTAVIIGGNDGTFGALTERFEGRGVTVIGHLSCLGGKLFEISSFLSENRTDIAVIIESDCTEGLVLCLKEHGIRGIWNMTQTDIICDIPMVNLPLGDIIMALCYNIKHAKGEKSSEP